MDNTGRQHLQEGMAKHGGYIEFKKSLLGFRFSMYPAASNAHLKALRLNFLFVYVWVEIVCQEQSTFSPEKTKRPIQTFLTFLSVECSYRPNSLGLARSER